MRRRRALGCGVSAPLAVGLLLLRPLCVSAATSTQTYTVTLPSSSLTATKTISATLPTVTTTVTLPTATSTATSTFTIPSGSATVTLPTSTITVSGTITLPSSTLTSTWTLPTSTQTSTVTLPTGTTTLTETFTLPSGTMTTTLTVTLPTGTVTEVETYTMPTTTDTATQEVTATVPTGTFTSTSTMSGTETLTFTLPSVTSTTTVTLPTDTVTLTVTLPSQTTTASLSATISPSFSLTPTFSMTLPSASSTVSESRTFSETRTETFTRYNIDPRAELWLGRPRGQHPRLYLWSASPAPAVEAMGSISSVIVILRGAAVRNWNFQPTNPAGNFTILGGQGRIPAPEQGVCAQTQVDRWTWLLNCRPRALPAIVELEFEYRASVWVTAGWVHLGSNEEVEEQACASVHCHSPPYVESVSGCFNVGGSTFGCDPLSPNPLTVIGRRLQYLRGYDLVMGGPPWWSPESWRVVFEDLGFGRYRGFEKPGGGVGAECSILPYWGATRDSRWDRDWMNLTDAHDKATNPGIPGQSPFERLDPERDWKHSTGVPLKDRYEYYTATDGKGNLQQSKTEGVPLSYVSTAPYGGLRFRCQPHANVLNLPPLGQTLPFQVRTRRWVNDEFNRRNSSWESTGWDPAYAAPSVSYAPTVTALEWQHPYATWNARYDSQNGGHNTTSRLNPWYRIETRGHNCYYTDQGVSLVCVRAEMLPITVHGWGFMSLCQPNTVQCGPEVRLISRVSGPLPVAYPAYRVSDTKAVFSLDAPTPGWGGPWEVVLATAQGRMTTSNATLSIAIPPHIDYWSCGNTTMVDGWHRVPMGAPFPFDLSLINDSLEVHPCEVPATITIFGKYFSTCGQTSLNFVLLDGPDNMGNMSCAVADVRPDSIVCDIRDTLPVPVANYSLDLISGGMRPLYDKVGRYGLWSRPVLTNVRGCAREHAASTAHCNGMQPLEIRGKRIPFYGATVYVGDVRCNETTPVQVGTTEADREVVLRCVLGVDFAQRTVPQVFSIGLYISWLDIIIRHPGVEAHFDPSPQVTGVSGCIGAGLLTERCPTVSNATSRISIHGTGFVGYGPLSVRFGWFRCSALRLVSDELAVCSKWDATDNADGAAHQGLPRPVVVERGGERSSGNAIVHFRALPYLTSVTGCVDDENGTAGCPAQKLAVPITVTGGDFTQGSAIRMWIGVAPCQRMTRVSTTTLICTRYMTAMGTEQLVTVEVDGERTPSRPSPPTTTGLFPHNIFYVNFGCYTTPLVNTTEPKCGGHGLCEPDASICVCSNQWDQEVACTQCRKGWWGMACDRRCTCQVGICDDGFNGTGRCISCSKDGWGPDCLPCASPGGLTCGGHGVCDQGINGTGFCKCEHSGWDEMRSCADCRTDRFGADCTKMCAGIVALPTGGTAPCFAHGVCRSGYAAPGTCQCDQEWGASDCSGGCPIDAQGQVCTGRGSCISGQCKCIDDSFRGHWAGTDCSSCRYGFSGSICTLECPRGGSGEVVCSGNGECAFGLCTCTAGFCAADCSLARSICDSQPCPQVWEFGPDCLFRCPGTNIVQGTVCSGHGSCDAGRSGGGTCSCHGSFRGQACEVDCAPCGGAAGGGSCDALGFCHCNYGWAGQWCDAQCPSIVQDLPGGGQQLMLCSGSQRGECSWGTSGTAECRCLPGWAGAACELECAGGASSPCSGHGECRKLDASCRCFQDENRGWWEGRACERCQPPFLPPACGRLCPGRLGDSSVVCSAHGRCRVPSATCRCERHHVRGYWAGEACDVCEGGYWGGNCSGICPGGACNPCSGHGECDAGRDGTGVCTCQADSDGTWSGEACDVCAPGWFGLECKEQCPGYFLNPDTSIVEVCNTRGTCDQGALGYGRCNCSYGRENGEHWGGPDCKDCVPGWFGSHCSERCPGAPPPAHCGGPRRGVCDGGTGGTGNCSCLEGWLGWACDQRCPRGPPESDDDDLGPVCGGHGACELSAWGPVCRCEGNWGEPSACTRCSPGWWGPDCASECPGGVEVPCRGRTEAGCDAQTGACPCFTGWGGSECEIECPGGEVAPCGGHGICRVADATCACFSSARDGWWGGDACEVCHPRYSGELCTVPCLLAAPADPLPCSGRGECFASNVGENEVAGRCLCSPGSCGETCATEGAACAVDECPPGMYGVQCTARCPGVGELAADDSGACNGHGTCDVGRRGTGECVCDPGWTLRDCSGDCSRCQQGSCLGSSDGDGVLCDCSQGWAGRWCDVECPGGFRRPCGGRGVCLDGAAGSGQCVCNTGWRDTDCSEPCPRGVGGGICSGHGDCQQLGPPCTCQRSGETGYWGGPRCADCAPGWSGWNCSTPCVNGDTAGTACRCWAAWYGPGCVSPCPGRLGNASDPQQPAEACGGHGVCDSGEHGAGTCVCNAAWYGALCSTFCRIDVNCTKHRRASVRCGASGCQCASGPQEGYWGGPLCAECQAGRWGPNCLGICPCQQRAYGCDQRSGDCLCWDDPVNGHWLPPNCQGCASGWTGVQCNQREVAITRVRSSLPIFSPTFANTDTAFQLYDTQFSRVIVCSTPPAVFLATRQGTAPEQEASANMQSYQHWGRILHASVSSDQEYIYFLQQYKGVVELVQAMRTILLVLYAFPLNPYASVDDTAIQGRRAGPLQTAAVDMPTPIAAAQLTDVWYVLYDIAGDLQLQAVVIEQGATASTLTRVAAKVPLGAMLDSAAAMTLFVDQWGVQRLVIAGTQRGRNELLVVSPPVSGALTAAGFTLAGLTARDPDMDLGTADAQWGPKLETMFNTHLFATITEADGDAKRLTVLRVDVAAALSFAGARGEVLREVVLRSALPFKPVSLRAAPVSELLHLVVRLYGADGQPQPSALYTIDPRTHKSTATTQFGFFSGEPEAVVDLVSVPWLRTGVALPAMPFLRLIELNNFLVEGVFPPYVDLAGGTAITVTGKGFLPGDESTWCVYLGRLLPARNITSSQAVCVAPRVPGIGDGPGVCESRPLEMSILGPDRVSRNDVRLNVVSASTAVTADPQFRAVGSSRTRLKLTGYNFRPSPVLRCRYSRLPGDSDAGAAQQAWYGFGQYISPSEINCTIPNLPAVAFNYYITATQDGTRYPVSQPQAIIRVIGEPWGLRTAVSNLASDAHISTPQWTAQVLADSQALIPEVYVHVIDDSGNSLAPYGTDAEVRWIVADATAHCEVAREGVLQEGANTTVEAEYTVDSSAEGGRRGSMLRGLVKFDSLFLRKPRIGSCTLRFREQDTGWFTILPLRIVPGKLFALDVVVPMPRAAGDPRLPQGAVATDPPSRVGPAVVQGVDGGGNQVTVGFDVVMRARYEIWGTGEVAEEMIPHQEELVPDLERGLWIVQLNTTGMLHGVQYQLAFAVSVRGVASAVDGPVLRRPCGDWRFNTGGELPVHARYMSPDCLPCPDGAKCNGTIRMVSLPEFWRPPMVEQTYPADPSNESYKLYSSFYRCSVKGACLGGEDSLCSEGHSGVLCDVCASGWAAGEEACEPCPAHAWAIVLTIGIIAALLLLTAAFTYRAVMDNLLARRSLTFVFLKLFISYMQMLAAVATSDEALQWPELLRDAMLPQNKFLTIHVSVSTFQCVADVSFYHRLFIIHSSPAAWFWALFLALIPYELRKRRQQEPDDEVAAIGDPSGTADYVEGFAHDAQAPPPPPPLPRPPQQRRMTNKSRRSFRAAAAGWGDPDGDSEMSERPSVDMPHPPGGASAKYLAPKEHITQFGSEVASEVSGPSGLAGRSPETAPAGLGVYTKEPPPLPPDPPPHVLAAQAARASGASEEPIPTAGGPRLSLTPPDAPGAEAPRSPAAPSESALPPGADPSSPFSPGVDPFASASPFYTGAPGAEGPAENEAGGLNRASSRRLSRRMSRGSRASRSGSIMGDRGRSQSLLRSVSAKGTDHSVRTAAARASVVQDMFASAGQKSVSNQSFRRGRSASLGARGSTQKPTRRRSSLVGGKRNASFVTRNANDLSQGGVQLLSGRKNSVGRGARVGRKLSITGKLELVFDTGDDNDSDELSEEWGVDEGGMPAGLHEEAGAAPVSRWVDQTRRRAQAQGRFGRQGAATEGQATGGAPRFNPKARVRAQRTAHTVHTDTRLLRFIVAPIPNLMQGTGSEPVSIAVTTAPSTAVRLTPVCADEDALSFVPRSILFTPSFTQGHLSVMGWEEGEYIIAWKVSGPSAASYAEPEPVSVLIFGELEIDTGDMFITGWLVGYWLLHPLIIMAASSQLDCRQLGDSWYVRADMRYKCYDDEWMTGLYVNIVGFALWALVFPGSVCAWMARHKDELEEPETRARVGFLTRGLQQRFWWWEFYMMGRKMALIIASVAVKRMLYRLFICQWVLFAAFAVHILAKPFVHSVHQDTESVVLVALVVTLNLGMYYFRDEELLASEGEDAVRASDAALWAVYPLLVASNLCVVLAVILFYFKLVKLGLVEEGRHGLIDSMDQDGDGDVSTVECVKVVTYRILRSLPCRIPCLKDPMAGAEEEEEVEEEEDEYAEDRRRQEQLETEARRAAGDEGEDDWAQRVETDATGASPAMRPTSAQSGRGAPAEAGAIGWDYEYPSKEPQRPSQGAVSDDSAFGVHRPSVDEDEEDAPSPHAPAEMRPRTASSGIPAPAAEAELSAAARAHGRAADLGLVPDSQPDPSVPMAEPGRGSGAALSTKPTAPGGLMLRRGSRRPDAMPDGRRESRPEGGHVKRLMQQFDDEDDGEMSPMPQIVSPMARGYGSPRQPPEERGPRASTVSFTGGTGAAAAASPPAGGGGLPAAPGGLSAGGGMAPTGSFLKGQTTLARVPSQRRRSQMRAIQVHDDDDDSDDGIERDDD
eukprot:TRINITY_DN2647_c0_g3_i1.p1 TRINITY_DN2647_c0_g3~~TRINITY_DN2647_c0_g3_i1.p1  ORF type:complete len:4800 (+),score=1009.59 TRINITY_DN2647_c0_g3_i1:104-14503(+)